MHLSRLPRSQSSVRPLQTKFLSSSKDLSRIRGSYPFFVTRNSVSSWYSRRTIGPMLYLKVIRWVEFITFKYIDALTNPWVKNKVNYGTNLPAQGIVQVESNTVVAVDAQIMFSSRHCCCRKNYRSQLYKINANE